MLKKIEEGLWKKESLQIWLFCLLTLSEKRVVYSVFRENTSQNHASLMLRGGQKTKIDRNLSKTSFLPNVHFPSIGVYATMSTRCRLASGLNQPYALFGLIAVIYFFVYFHRVSTSVIALDLLNAFHTDAAALGFMSSMYFYLYAFEQPFVGKLSDLLGPHKIIGVWIIIAACGCILFGWAPTIGWATVARGLIGLGVGGVYVPALKAFSQWFSKDKFARVTGLFLAAGNIGGIVATTPLAWMANRLGWRESFFLVGATMFGLGFLVLFLIRPRDASSNRISQHSGANDPGTVRLSATTLRDILTLRFWILGVLFFFPFGAYFALQGLWATPYIMSVLKLDQMRASGINMLMPVGYLIGAPFLGWFTDRVYNKKITIISFLLAAQSSGWGVLTLGLGICGVTLSGLLFLMGMLTGGLSTVLWSFVRDTTETRSLGLMLGLLNPFPLLGIAILQYCTGELLGRAELVTGGYAPEAYQTIFLIFFVITVLSLCLSAGFKKQMLREP